MGPWRRGRAARCLGAALLALLAGCATQIPEEPTRGATEIRADLKRLLPPQVPDRDGWARDIAVAFTAQGLDSSQTYLCAVLAVTEQESSFRADPAVPGLPGIARREIERRTQAMHVPAFLVNAALNVKSPTGKTYNQRLDTVRTEKQLSEIFEDFIGMVPMGRQLFSGLNPVHTGGPMQVSIAFAQAHAQDYPYAVEGSIRREVFTRRGGMYFGIAHLLGYPANYDSVLYRFADFNAGWYASRNAAFQAAVSRLSGIELALDGDLLIHGSIDPSRTERAVRAIRRRLDINEARIRPSLQKGGTLEFEETQLYRRVFELADKDAGQRVPRAVLPGIKLESPKITRNLTTAWFANRVHGRWKQCMAR
ncbi:DUF1615 domain-containing protein [Bordetella sp. BOR01]|uniref:DUF1615 domain-containing protein n=1 Tax=Bordetella sp. BOR01 TaxID=2854779 RepID=UPI001C43A4A9|nr:DUF1615 domain-containing protein [Bordetella sp. BOR01]MBV7484766.1 DUF1615 domain-containing protein [Bordetella sp. BOR01]